MKIVTVLRSGGDYDENHVRWIHRQLPDNYEKICLTDLDIPDIKTIKLRTNFPGWWSKIELFNPDLIDDDIFYIDLDVVVVGDITELTEQRELMMLEDFFSQEMYNSAMMFIPHNEKMKVWKTFNKYPEQFMTRYKKGGDQEFISRILPHAKNWQHLFPGKICSYKKHVVKKSKKYSLSVGNGKLPDDIRIVFFHGKPRPWNSGEKWVPSLQLEKEKGSHDFSK
ncbi:hypothetical protein [Rosenbergiella australiborealis]|uniref:Glycosyltransferase n=1 Tax=Rosenbergiella australiborealis TaxID=1544696 RepID=A0ABS5TA11_9GAMM|nr:hypothetical protein [Rosenbergiella australiborealis]MBT0727798.1 hypothetical protein [Rosenbergiella australiborealis]